MIVILARLASQDQDPRDQSPENPQPVKTEREGRIKKDTRKKELRSEIECARQRRRAQKGQLPRALAIGVEVVSILLNHVQIVIFDINP